MEAHHVEAQLAQARGDNRGVFLARERGPRRDIGRDKADPPPGLIVEMPVRARDQSALGRKRGRVQRGHIGRDAPAGRIVPRNHEREPRGRGGGRGLRSHDRRGGNGWRGGLRPRARRPGKRQGSGKHQSGGDTAVRSAHGIEQLLEWRFVPPLLYCGVSWGAIRRNGLIGIGLRFLVAKAPIMGGQERPGGDAFPLQTIGGRIAAGSCPPLIGG